VFPLESIELPARKKNGLDDIPPVALRMAKEACGIIIGNTVKGQRLTTQRIRRIGSTTNILPFETVSGTRDGGESEIF
jgi:hypothetical protein